MSSSKYLDFTWILHSLKRSVHQLALDIGAQIISIRHLEMTANEKQRSSVVGASLIEAEKMEIGGVKWTVYNYYARSIGLFFSIGTFVLYLVYQVSSY